MKIYLETPVKVEKGDFLVVDNVQEKGCHCGTRKYVVQLTTADSLLGQEHPHRAAGKGGIKRGPDPAHPGHQRFQLEDLEREEGKGTSSSRLD